MTLDERARCIADVCDGTARGTLRRQRVYDKALKMLQEVVAETAAIPREKRIRSLKSPAPSQEKP